MAAPAIKDELQRIADSLPATATYADAMYALYVRMKVQRGRDAVEAGRVVDHEKVKRRFTR